MAIQQVMHLFYCTILWPLWILAVSAAECSYPVHNATSQDGWAPTDMPCTDEPESVCCFPGYACLENKLCQRTPESTDGFATGMLFRGSCTDPIWQSPACPLFCYNDGEDQTGGSLVFPCSEFTYCCAQFNTSSPCNCTTGEGVFTLSGGTGIVTVIPNEAFTGDTSTITVVPSTYPLAPLPGTTTSPNNNGDSVTSSPITPTLAPASLQDSSTSFTLDLSLSGTHSNASSPTTFVVTSKQIGATVTSTPSISPDAHNGTTAASGLSATTVIGLSVSLPLSALVICAMIYMGLLRARQRARTTKRIPELSVGESKEDNMDKVAWGPPLHELLVPPSELPSMHPDRQAVELPSNAQRVLKAKAQKTNGILWGPPPSEMLVSPAELSSLQLDRQTAELPGNQPGSIETGGTEGEGSTCIRTRG